MRRLLALAFAVGAMAWVRDLEVPAVSAASVAALALGFALLGASVTGDALRQFHLPRLTGYLLFGVIVGPHVANLITESMAAQLQVVTGIATTLIAFIAGLDAERRTARARLAGITRMTLVTLAWRCSALPCVWLFWPWLPIAPEASGTERLVMMGLLTVMIVVVLADDDGRGVSRDRARAAA